MTAAPADTTAGAATLELIDVTKIYPGQAEPAIPGLTLTVPAGEICVLVGPSGSGKTTAMRLINRMIPLSSGEIRLGGESVLGKDATALRREIGYVIQQIGLFPHLTIAENIATVPRLLGWAKPRIAERTRELLELIGLDPASVGHRYPHQLSGGQQQRVGVARALAADPPLLLMDEPFGAIDPINRARLQDEFLALQARVRKTVVFVTHDIDEAIKMGDRIAILAEGGHLAQYAPPAELLQHPVSDFVADFVGADRALKALGLITLADIRLDPTRNGSTPTPTLELRTTLRDALATVLAAGGADQAVADGDGSPVGMVSLELLAKAGPADAAPEATARPGSPGP